PVHLVVPSGSRGGDPCRGNAVRESVVAWCRSATRAASDDSRRSSPMTHGTLDDASSSRLFDLVHGVKRRWRLARVLRGAAVALGVLLATLVVLGVALDRLSYPPAFVVAGRI